MRLRGELLGLIEGIIRSMSHDRSGIAAPSKCNECDRPLASPLVCQHCRRLVDAGEADHFALLGLERDYDLGAETLSERFVALSRQVHPDYFSEQPGGQGRLAMRNSARLNQAYRTLRDPFTRAEYLLELAGGACSAEDRSVPANLLAEAMQLREQIEEAKSQSDDATLVNIRKELLARRDHTDERIRLLARQAARPDVSPEVLRDLRKQLNAFKYYANLLEQL
jgi:molecular chaperone HscB